MLPTTVTFDLLSPAEMEPAVEQEIVEHIQDVIQDGKWRKNRQTRMKTPLRRAILDMETMPEKRQLRRNQQALSDLGHHVREQEVQLLSHNITSPMLPRLSPRIDVFLRAHTTTPATPFSKSRATTSKGDRMSEAPESIVNKVESTIINPPIHMRPNDRSFTRVGGLAGSNYLQKSFSAGTRYPDPSYGLEESGRIRFSKGVHFANANNRNRLLYSRDINGPIQLQMYTEKRPDIRPLILTAFRQGLMGKDLNRVETFVNSRPAFVSQKVSIKPQMYSTLKTQSVRHEKKNLRETSENPISSW